MRYHSLKRFMSINRQNFGRVVVASRALLGLNRLDLSSRAHVGHETVARAERGEDGVSVNSLAAIQRALEEAGVEFPDGTLRPSIRLRETGGLNGCCVATDPSMPSGTRFQGG